MVATVDTLLMPGDSREAMMLIVRGLPHAQLEPLAQAVALACDGMVERAMTSADHVDLALLDLLDVLQEEIDQRTAPPQEVR